jgi:YfiH family protein
MSLDWIIPAWGAPARVRALSTRRGGGVSVGRYQGLNLGTHVGDTPAAVAENRRRLRAAADLPAEPAWLQQVHGADVLDLDRAADGGAGAPAGKDAAFTRGPGRVCAILTADCVPILLAATDGTAVAAAHAGWRGLAAGVVAATVRALETAPAQLAAWIGPCIGADRYEVGAEVRSAMIAADPQAGSAFRAGSNGKFLADLALLARLQLQALGVARIEAAGECTYADPDRYFSHRRDGQTGRQATLIWLEGAS